MDNKSVEHFITMQDTIESNNKDMKANKHDLDEKVMKIIEEFKGVIASSIPSLMNKINTLKHSTTHKASPKTTNPTTVVPSNRRALTLVSGQSMKISGMWKLKHEIRSQKIYVLLINI